MELALGAGVGGHTWQVEPQGKSLSWAKAQQVGGTKELGVDGTGGEKSAAMCPEEALAHVHGSREGHPGV